MSARSADNPERIDRIHRIAPREVVEALNTSDDPVNDAVLTCQICKGSYYSADANGRYEIPYMTPCGHVLGSTCVQKWAGEPTVIRCPMCRFVMHFTGCGHLIAPRPAFNNFHQTPPSPTVGNVPDTCFQCEHASRHAVLQAELNGLLAGHKELERQAGRLLMEPGHDAMFPMAGQDGSGEAVPPQHPLPLEAMHRLNEARNMARDSLTALRDAKARADAELAAMDTACEASAQRGEDFWRYGQTV